MRLKVRLQKGFTDEVVGRFTGEVTDEVTERVCR